MSEKKSLSPDCTRCKKELLSHLQFHSLKAVGANGSLEIDCYPEPHGKVGDPLKYVLETRAAAMVAQSDLKTALRNHATDLASKIGDAERRAASEAQIKVAADIAAKEALHKKALEDCERTRVEAQSAHIAKVTHLEDVLKEVRGDKQTLLTEKQALADKLAASEKGAFDLRLEVGELKEELLEERRQHEDLKQEAKDVLRLAFTIGGHVTTLGRKLGVDGEAGIKKLFAKKAAPRPPIVVEDLTGKAAKPAAAPPPIPTPAPKAEVVTANAAAPVAVPAPVPTTVTVVLDAPTPDPDSSASADDEGEEDEFEEEGDEASGGEVDDHAVGDDVVIIDEMEAGSEAGDDVSSDEEGQSEDDDMSSEEVAPEECRACDKTATHGFTFSMRDGSRNRLTTCNPRKHVPDFLKHLQDEAAVDPEGVLKTMPRTAGELVALLKANPINPNP